MSKIHEFLITRLRFEKIKKGENHYDLKSEFWRTLNPGDKINFFEYIFDLKNKENITTGKVLTRIFESATDIKSGKRLFFK